MRIFGLTLFVELAGVMTAQAPSHFQPVGNVTQVMVDIIYPASDALFYIETIRPRTIAIGT